MFFFLAGSSWSLATPLAASPDEADQMIKAVAVAHGQLVGTPVANPASPRTFVTVPASFVSALHLPGCFIGHRDVTPACEPPLSSSNAPLRVSIYVGRYPPLYYALVGLPSRFVDGVVALRAMRLVSVALNSIFLALALSAVVLWARRRRLLVGLFLAVSPEVLFLSGVLNPSSLEISAAICLWTAVLVLALEPEPPPRALVAIAAFAACVEALCRPLSPLWVALLGLVGLGLAGRHRVLELWAIRAVRVGAACVVVASALASTWILRYHATDVQTIHGAAAHAITGSYAHALLERQELYLHETIGLFGTDDVPAPGATYLTWSFAAALLVVLALLRGGWHRRLTFCFLCLAAVAVPFGIVLSQAGQRHGLVWQGRDGAPLALGIPIVATALLAERVRFDRLEMVVLAAICPLLALAEVAAFLGTLNRYVVGFDRPFQFFSGGTWRPPLGALTLGVVFSALALAAGVLGAKTLWADRPFNTRGAGPAHSARGGSALGRRHGRAMDELFG